MHYSRRRSRSWPAKSPTACRPSPECNSTAKYLRNIQYQRQKQGKKSRLDNKTSLSALVGELTVSAREKRATDNQLCHDASHTPDIHWKWYRNAKMYAADTNGQWDQKKSSWHDTSVTGEADKKRASVESALYLSENNASSSAWSQAHDTIASQHNLGRNTSRWRKNHLNSNLGTNLTQMAVFFWLFREQESINQSINQPLQIWPKPRTIFRPLSKFTRISLESIKMKEFELDWTFLVDFLFLHDLITPYPSFRPGLAEPSQSLKFSARSPHWPRYCPALNPTKREKPRLE